MTLGSGQALLVASWNGRAKESGSTTVTVETNQRPGRLVETKNEPLSMLFLFLKTT